MLQRAIEKHGQALLINILLQSSHFSTSIAFINVNKRRHVLRLRCIIYLCALLVTFVGFTQAFSGLPAARCRVEGSHHLTGPIAKSSLYAVSIVQLLHLEKQTRKMDAMQFVISHSNKEFLCPSMTHLESYLCLCKEF